MDRRTDGWGNETAIGRATAGHRAGSRRLHRAVSSSPRLMVGHQCHGEAIRGGPPRPAPATPPSTASPAGKQARRDTSVPAGRASPARRSEAGRARPHRHPPPWSATGHQRHRTTRPLCRAADSDPGRSGHNHDAHGQRPVVSYDAAAHLLPPRRRPVDQAERGLLLRAQ